MTKIVPVILCGGSGTRLWPRSRAIKPKPFLPLIGEHTLFEATQNRCMGSDDFAPPVVVTGTLHLTHVEEQLVDAAAQVIVEPQARNTAAAIALAALRLPAEAVMLVCPSDHHIGDCAARPARLRRRCCALAARRSLARRHRPAVLRRG
jgi:mannose-1-phosphate guanylyltransferase